ncbi:MAG: hypothetical protein JWN52_1269 [Actinomycetia bacterium]|jgi:hypothetical protein|nr:hypothetical protein [Actinomycetes bacterium]
MRLIRRRHHHGPVGHSIIWRSPMVQRSLTHERRPQLGRSGQQWFPEGDRIDPRKSRLAALAVLLSGHSYVAEVHMLHLLAYTEARPGTVVEVWCASRVSDGDRLWFSFAGGDPICEADDLTGAVVAVKGALSRVRM